MTAPVDQELPVPPSCRLSILVGEDHQVDMVVPAATPVGTLIEPLREALNRALRARGAAELPVGDYELARAAGGAGLSTLMSLTGQGIRDGELVVFLPTGEAQRYTATIENVSTALARWARSHLPSVSPQDAVAVGAALIGVALLGSSVLLWRCRWATSPLPVAAVFAGLAVVLALTAAVTVRTKGPRVLSDGATWAAAAAAVLAGATGAAGAHPGAPHAFLAAVIALLVAMFIARMTQRFWTAAAAISTVALATVAVAAVRMFTAISDPQIGIVALVVVVIGAKVAPSIGRRLAKVPRQSFASITGKDIFDRSLTEPDAALTPVDSAPHDATLRGEALAAVARRSNRVLLGVLLGIAVIEVAAAVAAVDPAAARRWPEVTIVMASSLVLILRARAFRDRRHAITMVAGAVVAMLAVPIHWGLSAPAGATGAALECAGVAVGIAVAGLVAAAVVPARMFTEVFRVVVEYTEYVLAALLLPFAAWSVGLFEFIRMR